MAGWIALAERFTNKGSRYTHVSALADKVVTFHNMPTFHFVNQYIHPAVPRLHNNHDTYCDSIILT